VVDSPRDVLPPLGMGIAGGSSGSSSDSGNGGAEQQHVSTSKPPRQRLARRQGLSKEFAGWVPAAVEERASAAGRCVRACVCVSTWAKEMLVQRVDLLGICDAVA
jgi:hypothetical protein